MTRNVLRQYMAEWFIRPRDLYGRVIKTPCILFCPNCVPSVLVSMFRSAEWAPLPHDRESHVQRRDYADTRVRRLVYKALMGRLHKMKGFIEFALPLASLTSCDLTTLEPRKGSGSRQ